MLYTNFNDANGNITTHFPSVGLGLLLELPPNKKKSPEVATHYVDPASPDVAFVEGSYSTLANGNGFLGYGYAPFVREFGKDSPMGDDVLYSAQFAYYNLNNTASSYRAFKQTWNATPTAPVELVVTKNSTSGLNHCDCGSDIRGYVSWNGMTNNACTYAVHTGSQKSKLQDTGIKFNRKSFEMEFVVPEGAKFVQVMALLDGKEIGKSAVVAV